MLAKKKPAVLSRLTTVIIDFAESLAGLIKMCVVWPSANLLLLLNPVNGVRDVVYST